MSFSDQLCSALRRLKDQAMPLQYNSRSSQKLVVMMDQAALPECVDDRICTAVGWRPLENFTRYLWVLVCARISWMVGVISDIAKRPFTYIAIYPLPSWKTVHRFLWNLCFGVCFVLFKLFKLGIIASCDSLRSCTVLKE